MDKVGGLRGAWLMITREVVIGVVAKAGTQFHRFVMSRIVLCPAILVLLALTANTRGREWKDTTGEFSVEATYMGMEGDSIVKLRKDDGEIVRVPLSRLNRKDRELLDWAIGISTADTVVGEIRVAFQKGYNATDAKVRIVEREAMKKIIRRFDRRRITLVFPIQNVDASRSREGLYDVYVGNPDSDWGRYREVTRSTQRVWTVPLTQEAVLAINNACVLVVSGKLRMNYSKWGMYHRAPISFSSSKTDSYIRLYLVSAQYRIENENAGVGASASFHSSERRFNIGVYLDQLEEYRFGNKEFGAEEPDKKEPNAFRTWLDSTEKFTIEAKFFSYANGKVTLEKKDGSKVILPIERLSVRDQKNVNELRRKP